MPRFRPRREILRRVVEFEDFSTCWPNERFEAEGLVARIRSVVDVKDSFTRMRQERDAEVSKIREQKRREAEALKRRQKNIEGIRKDFNLLFAMDDAHKRGRLLEGVMNRLFRESDILIRDAFTRVSQQGSGIAEQIDGVIDIDGNIYLVEMKWLTKPVGVPDVSHHLVRVFNRSASHGIFISYSEYTDPAINICKESLSQAVVVLCTLREFVMLLESEMTLKEFLRAKIQGSIINKQPYTKVI